MTKKELIEKWNKRAETFNALSPGHDYAAGAATAYWAAVTDLQSLPKTGGAKWVKATKKPSFQVEKRIPVRFIDTGTATVFIGNEADWDCMIDFEGYHYKKDQVEYLDESPLPASEVKDVESDVKKAAEEYANFFYKEHPYDHFESDYDYRIHCAKRTQIIEHFLAGTSFQAAQQNNELQQLKDWKESAMKVMPDYQAIGKLIGVKLGDTVHDKLLPWIEQQSKLREAKDICVEQGHVMFKVFETQNHQSIWGTNKCSRCAHEEDYQYDFPNGNPNFKG